MESKNTYIVQGGKKLQGEVYIEGAKNAAIKLMIGALLFDGDVVIENVPTILDVEHLIALLRELDVNVTHQAEHTLIINKKNLKLDRVNLYYASKIRSSFLLLAPLLYHFGRAYIPNPGGCKLGARSIDRIIDAAKMLNIKVDYNESEEYYHASLEKGQPRGVCRFEKTTHTGTELLLLIAAKTSHEVVIENASLEPEIDDLILFLNEGGANIKRNGRNIICQGATKLVQKKPFKLMGDRLVAGTYAIATLATKGSVVIQGVDKAIMAPIDSYLAQVGALIEYIAQDRIKYTYTQPIRSMSVTTDVYPGFMTDIQPLWALLMTQAEGDTIIHERLFENRFSYVEELNKLGADIKFVHLPVGNPEKYYYFNYQSDKKYQQAIFIQGPKKLNNGALQMMDIRAGATVAIASLLCEGESVVHGIHHMKRGYPKITEKLKALGAEIKEI